MATSYMNRPGSRLTKLPGELGMLIQDVIPDTARFAAKAKIQGLELVGKGNLRGLAVVIDNESVSLESLVINHALWRNTGGIGIRPTLHDNVHLRLGKIGYELGARAISDMETLPSDVLLDPAVIRTDMKY